MKKILKYIYFYIASTKLYMIFLMICIRFSRILGFNVSLSQFGEDLIIKSLVNKKSGFYVDVGCNRPILKNNTFLLYADGYVGLNIDGNAAYQNAWKNLRPRDKFVSEIISNDVADVNFNISEVGYVSTISVEYMRGKSFVYERVEMRSPKTLTNVLKNNGVDKIDVLCIDVEGHDYEVLLSLDFNLYKPDLICIEDHTFDDRLPNKSRTYCFLLNKKYILVANIPPNLFFKKY